MKGMQPNFVGVYCHNFVLNLCRFHGCRASWTAGWNPTMGWLQKTGLFVAVCAYCERCSLNLQVSYSNAKQLSHTFVYWTQSRHIYITRCLVHRGVYLKIARDMRRGGLRDMSWRRCQHLDGWHWLWNAHPEEHFLVHKPPVQWTRYMCASGVHTKESFSWWYNIATCRWFYEHSLIK